MSTPSSTVENYLKAIYQAQTIQGAPGDLVPMGQLAASLGVVPGTATTMVKALADSGLVTYEPYAGVRLTAAGEKLAALVLRRHRLIELFLVQVMGMSWAEVHEEAEHLEHAVSDRLIERIDRMLGSPDVDPHGDPIPSEEGHMPARQYDSLLTCPLRTPVKVVRVADQDAEFLRFIEKTQLKPGEIVRIDERDPAADRVNLTRRDETITIGTRAAAKLMVQAVLALVLLLLGSPAAAQQSPASEGSRPFEIQDNSFLVEEAFNQESGIYQNIFGFVRADDAWELAFTQEWPLGSEKHQLSYTLPFGGYGSNGLGDALLTYRYQLWSETGSRPAFSPRVSLVLPTGGRTRGYDALGFQMNLPFSKQAGDWYFHWNGGFTTLPAVDHLSVIGEHVHLFTPHLSGSAIWRARPMVHVMLESVLESEHSLAGASPGGGLATARRVLFTLSPGVRVGRNFADRQLVAGAALPVTFDEEGSQGAALLYLSYELSFRR